MEVTRELVEQTFPFGAWYIPNSDNKRAILVGPFEFEDDDLTGVTWALPNKAYVLDFSKVREDENGWYVSTENDLEVFIRPASESQWDTLRPQLED